MQAEPGRCPSAVALLAPVLSSCASGFLVRGLGLLWRAWAWQGECVKASPAAESLEAFLTRGPPLLPAGVSRASQPGSLCSLFSRINEKSVWCCGWLPCTPLRIAATAGHGNCVDFLIRKGAEVDLVDVKGQTALYVAVVNGHLESAQILLEAGADPNGSRHHRSTPVYHASRVGRADILKALIRSVLGLRPAAAAAFSFLIFSSSQSRLVTGFVCFVFFKSCFLALSVLLFSDWLISIFIYFCPCFPWFSSTFSLTF